MSSLSRAFTLRSKRTKDDIKETSPPPSLPGRSASMRYTDRPVDIRTISSPVALLSTTNMLSYNAPDVSSVRAQRKASNSVSSGSSLRSSADESDTSTISTNSRDTASTDVSSIGSSSPAASPETKELDRMSYFPSSRTLNRSPSTTLAPPLPSTQRISKSVSTSALRPSSTLILDSERVVSPEIPQRAASHSKKAHEVLARKRSLQTMSRQNSVSSIKSTSLEKRNSFEFFSGKITDAPAPSLPSFGFQSAPSPLQSNPPQTSHHSASHSGNHPFGKELMQLDEIAEEFGGAVRDVEREGDLRAMRQKGLQRFRAEDYMREIEKMLGGFSKPHNLPVVPERAIAYPTHVQQEEVAWI
ncbi:gb [Venturia nashicola]|uniref:Gb n=1 Tax=Venturia nashicola TaxID=86259 RepID=A0A4Z1NY43_9PEZI|nr:gb [Venturia nashicola]TLD24531.1 gb [Venturia nashicola]